MHLDVILSRYTAIRISHETVRYIYDYVFVCVRAYRQIYLNLDLHLQGFVISDWQGLDRITTPDHADYLLSIKLGILAGIDMVIE
jgi:hypothetical protein